MLALAALAVGLITAPPAPAAAQGQAETVTLRVEGMS
jgi:hypothetical protein